jgi:hypothetical protein
LRPWNNPWIAELLLRAEAALRSTFMKNALLVGVTALALTAGSESFAQAVAVEVAPEQRTVIREYVVKQNVRPITIQGEVRVGSALPPDVQLVEVPSAWGPALTKYRYVYWNNQVVLVEPSSRKVVHVIN